MLPAARPRRHRKPAAGGPGPPPPPSAPAGPPHRRPFKGRLRDRVKSLVSPSSTGAR